MQSRERLFLYEEVLLVALHDVKGAAPSGMTTPYAIAGAILAELLLERWISVEDSKKRLVNLVSKVPVGDPLLDECLQRIGTAKRRSSLSSWLSRFAQMKNLQRRIAEQLCRRGILREEAAKVLLVFDRKIYPQVDPGPEREIVKRIRNALLRDNAEVEPRTTILIALASVGRLLPMVLEKSEIKNRKAVIEKITKGDMVGKATKEAIEAMEAVIAVVCLIPVITATVT